MFAYFKTPAQCNYSLHNTRTFCAFFSLAILRGIALPLGGRGFQESAFFFFSFFFFLLFSVTAALILRYLSPSMKREHFFFCIGRSVDSCKTTASLCNRSYRHLLRPETARGCVGCWNHKRFSDVQDTELRCWTTRPIMQSFSMLGSNMQTC